MALRPSPPNLNALNTLSVSDSVPALAAVVGYPASGALPFKMLLASTAAYLTTNGYTVTNPASSVVITDLSFAALGAPPANAPSGTSIGTLSATVTGGALIGSAWTLSATGGRVSLNGTTVQLASSSIAQGSYSFTARLSASNASYREETFNFIVAPAQTPSGTLAISFQIKATTAIAVGDPITYYQPFGPYDMPAGYRPTVASTAAPTTLLTVQQDQEPEPWADGASKGAALSFLAPAAVASGSIASFVISREFGVPNRTPHMTVAALVAQSTLAKFRATGVDFGTDVFEMSPAEVVASFNLIDPATSWGTNYPEGGYEAIRLGPLCVEYYFWRMARRTSDGAKHRWFKMGGYVRQWVNGAREYMPTLMQPNVYGSHPAGTINCIGKTAEVEGRIACFAELVSGSTVLKAWGGPNDTEKFTINISDINKTTQRITLPADVLSTIEGPKGCAVQLSGDLPANVSPNDVYYLEDKQGWTLSLTRDLTPYYEKRPAWVSGNSYGPGAFVTSSNGVVYKSYNQITGPSTVAPTHVTGAGSDTNGHQWVRAGVFFGAGGSGTITVTPVCATFAISGFVGAASDGHPVWQHTSARPGYMVAHDEEYLLRKSRFTMMQKTVGVPRPAATPVMRRHVVPNINHAMDILDGTGDGPGDNRIGWFAEEAIATLYTPFDPTRDRDCRLWSLQWAGMRIWSEDERSGQPVAFRKGVGATTAQYPGLGPNNVNFEMRYNRAAGNPAWGSEAKFGEHSLADEDGTSGSYPEFLDSSHLPNYWSAAYVRTGHHVHVRIGRATMMTVSVSRTPNYGDSGREIDLNGTHYSGVINGQQRGIAWQIAGVGNLLHVLPQGDPVGLMLKDSITDTGRFYSAYAQVSAYAHLGKAIGQPRPWWDSMTMMAGGQELRRGRSTFKEYMENVWFGAGVPYDDEGPLIGGGFRIGTYEIFPTNPATGVPYTTVKAMFEAANGASPYPAAGVQYFLGGYLYDAAYETMNIAGIAMMAECHAEGTVSIPRAPIVYAALINRITTAPLLGFRFGIDGNPNSMIAQWAVTPTVGAVIAAPVEGVSQVSGTIIGPASAAQANVPATFAITFSGAPHVYAGFRTGGADLGPRTQVASSGNKSLVPPSSTTQTAAIFAQLTGGVPLAETSPFTPSAAPAAVDNRSPYTFVMQASGVREFVLGSTGTLTATVSIADGTRYPAAVLLHLSRSATTYNDYAAGMGAINTTYYQNNPTDHVFYANNVSMPVAGTYYLWATTSDGRSAVDPQPFVIAGAVSLTGLPSTIVAGQPLSAVTVSGTDAPVSKYVLYKIAGGVEEGSRITGSLMPNNTLGLLIPQIAGAYTIRAWNFGETTVVYESPQITVSAPPGALPTRPTQTADTSATVTSVIMNWTSNGTSFQVLAREGTGSAYGSLVNATVTTNSYSFTGRSPNSATRALIIPQNANGFGTPSVQFLSYVAASATGTITGMASTVGVAAAFTVAASAFPVYAFLRIGTTIVGTPTLVAAAGTVNLTPTSAVTQFASISTDAAGTLIIASSSSFTPSAIGPVYDGGTYIYTWDEPTGIQGSYNPGDTPRSRPAGMNTYFHISCRVQVAGGADYGGPVHFKFSPNPNDPSENAGYGGHQRDAYQYITAIWNLDGAGPQEFAGTFYCFVGTADGKWNRQPGTYVLY